MTAATLTPVPDKLTVLAAQVAAYRAWVRAGRPEDPAPARRSQP